MFVLIHALFEVAIDLNEAIHIAVFTVTKFRGEFSESSFRRDCITN